MKVVVTGGAGFIGANLCRALTAQPGIGEVVAIDDLSTGYERNLEGLPARLIVGSILDRGLLTDAVQHAEAVVHLAAIPSVPRSLENPLATHHANTTGTLEVLEAARQAGDVHVIVASSSSVYGRNHELPKHEGLRCEPMSPYGVSKLATETYALAYAECFGLRVLPFRFFNVFGPLQAADHAYAAVIPAFVSAALDGRPLPLEGDGSQTRDFTFVESVTSVICEAVRQGTTHDGAVNLAFGTRVHLTEVIDQLADILGRRVPVETRPPRVGDVPHSQADNSRLRHLFPDVQPVPLRRGLELTVDWMSRARETALSHR